jgi:hypothetical protein
VLQGAGYIKEKSDDIAERLVTGYKLHEEVINLEKACSVGLNCVPSTNYQTEWLAFREWFGSYMLKSTEKHIIRYVIDQSLRKSLSVNPAAQKGDADAKK